LRALYVFSFAALTATTVLSAQDQERVVRALRFEGNQAIDDVTLASVKIGRAHV